MCGHVPLIDAAKADTERRSLILPEKAPTMSFIRGELGPDSYYIEGTGSICT
jgi:hypothetical protein